MLFVVVVVVVVCCCGCCDCCLLVLLFVSCRCRCLLLRLLFVVCVVVGSVLLFVHYLIVFSGVIGCRCCPFLSLFV